jgi:hypothetical protein
MAYDLQPVFKFQAQIQRDLAQRIFPFFFGGAAYYRKGMKTEHGWVYAFAEPYQIFIIYMGLQSEGNDDHQNIKAILDSFEVLPRQ